MLAFIKSGRFDIFSVLFLHVLFHHMLLVISLHGYIESD